MASGDYGERKITGGGVLHLLIAIFVCDSASAIIAVMIMKWFRG